MKKLLLPFLLIHVCPNLIFAQGDYTKVPWQANKKLSLQDFQIKTKDLLTTTSYGQFSVSYKIKGFDFAAKSFNKKVENNFISSASWIDTSHNIPLSLKYQQTLFDISEIYARQFRKALRENRKKLLSGTSFVEELSQKFMAEFSNRRINYDAETEFGTLTEKQASWEQQIQIELQALDAYGYDK